MGTVEVFLIAKESLIHDVTVLWQGLCDDVVRAL